MHKIIFTGPTLSYQDISMHYASYNLVQVMSASDVPEVLRFSTKRDAMIIAPPISGGDLYGLIDCPEDFLIAIIDGFFENQTSVWHKEILYLMSQGIKVFGAASMGALRAAELHLYGMVGVGEVYKGYVSGVLEDDDEVTVSHGPLELGYPMASEAMVNIRCTIESALYEDVISRKISDLFIKTAKETFYKDRNYGRVIRSCIDSGQANECDFARFYIWIQSKVINQKKRDALALMDVISDFNDTLHAPCFDFNDTMVWHRSNE